MSYDDLRNSAMNVPPFLEDEPVEKEKKPSPSGQKPRRPSSTRRSKGNFLGMTAPQRFVIALLLLIMTCTLGGFCLVLTDKVALPFF